MKDRILLIIPAYNEEENILGTYKEIRNFNKNNKVKYDVIEYKNNNFYEIMSSVVK